MRVAVLSQMYPCRRHPSSGIFFANLLRELADRVERLYLVAPRIYFPKVLAKLRPKLEGWLIDEHHAFDRGIEIFRPFVLFMPFAAAAGLNGILMHYSLRKLFGHLRNAEKVDLLLGYSAIPEGIATVRLAKELNLPNAFWVIGSDINETMHKNRLSRALVCSSLMGSDFIFAESNDLFQTVKRLTEHRSHVMTFYKGIQVDNFLNMPCKLTLITKLGLNIGRRYLLFVGRLIQSKGIYELAAAFARIAKKYPDFDLICIGEEVERDAFMRVVARAQISHRVILRGVVPYNQVAEYMHAADLLVFPSWAEGLPNVVLEAMAVGLPVVASDVGGTGEVIEHDVTGILVPPKDIDKLAFAIIRAIEDKSLRERIIKNARKRVLRDFDVTKNVDVLVDYLKELRAKPIRNAFRI